MAELASEVVFEIVLPMSCTAPATDVVVEVFGRGSCLFLSPVAPPSSAVALGMFFLSSSSTFSSNVGCVFLGAFFFMTVVDLVFAFDVFIVFLGGSGSGSSTGLFFSGSAFASCMLRIRELLLGGGAFSSGALRFTAMVNSYDIKKLKGV
jgi:hypothetical protein